VAHRVLRAEAAGARTAVRGAPGSVNGGVSGGPDGERACETGASGNGVRFVVAGKFEENFNKAVFDVKKDRQPVEWWEARYVEAGHGRSEEVAGTGGIA